MPCFAWQPSGERRRTRFTPDSAMVFARTWSTSSPRFAMIAPVLGCTTSCASRRPNMRSWNGSTMPGSSALAKIPSSSPQSSIRTMTSCATSTRRRGGEAEAGEVAGVGGADGRVGQTLAATVRRDEVLEDREALAEVRADRQVDDATLRVGDESAHSTDLTHLLRVTAGAGGGHHVDRP